MIEYLLMIMVCSNIDGDCTWSRGGSFPTEERCIANGLQALPAQFKCVVIEHRAGPDQRIPLPRPRPL
jgi:hypothetical protein